MPRFFIDTEDGDTTLRDDEGEDYVDLAEARLAAIASLPGMADEKLPDGEHRVFKATVRDEASEIVYVATLTFHGDWKGRGAAGERE